MHSRKKDFPIFNTNPSLVYLDSAATAQKPTVVIEAINNYYTKYNANIHRGLYAIAEKASSEVEEVRKKVANFIHASSPDEIVFTKSATEAINLVMYSWGRSSIKRGDIIITTIAEHHANFVPWQVLAAERNALLDVIAVNASGELDIEQLILDAKEAKFLAISYVSNMLGTVYDVSEIIKKIKKTNKDITILVDAAQAVPHMEVNVATLGCDFLVFSGHKMLAETGVGVLYAKKDVLMDMQPFLFGGDMIREVSLEKTTFSDLPNKFEGGTLHISGIISLGAAIDYLNSIGMKEIRIHERSLLVYCLKEIKNIEGLRIYGPEELSKRSGLISFTIDNIHPHDIAQVLADDGVCVRSGHHCTMPLHQSLGIPASVRASFYLYNNTVDIDRLVKGIYKAKQLFS